MISIRQDLKQAVPCAQPNAARLDPRFPQTSRNATRTRFRSKRACVSARSRESRGRRTGLLSNLVDLLTALSHPGRSPGNPFWRSILEELFERAPFVNFLRVSLEEQVEITQISLCFWRENRFAVHMLGR